MLRVLHCIYDDPGNPWVGGGGAMRAAEVYRRLPGQVEVTLATGSYPGSRSGEVDGIRYLRLGAPTPYAWSRWSYARAAAHLLARGDYDVGINDFSVYSPVQIPRHGAIGVVVHMVMGPTAHLRWGRVMGPAVAAAERRLLRRARWISTVSHWTAEQLRAMLGPGPQIRVVGNGVHDDYFRLSRRDEGYLLYYGRFDVVQKGLDTLLRAVALLVQDRPTLQLHIAGRGKDAGRIPILARELGVERNLRIHEGVSREDTFKLLSGAAALLMPSRFEGLPIVPMEAMAAGVPVVATRVGGTPEVVVPPESGVLVPPDDPVALAAATALLLDDSARREAMSRSARTSARRFSWDVVAGEHLEFLRDIVTGESRTPPPALDAE